MIVVKFFPNSGKSVATCDIHGARFIFMVRGNHSCRKCVEA